MCLQQCLKGKLGQEERLSEAVCVANGSSDIGVSEKLERIHAVDGFYENLREYVLDSCATDYCLPRFSIFSFNHFHEKLDIFGNERKQQYPLRLFIFDWFIGAIICQFVLFGLQQINDIFANGRQLQFDVLHKHHIHGFD